MGMTPWREWDSGWAARLPRLEVAVKLLTVFSLAAVIVVWWLNRGYLLDSQHLLRATLWGTVFLTAAQVFLAVKLSYFLWMLSLVRRYRPVAACSDAELPSCTVVVPAYNEGRQVLATLHSLAASDYPAAKLQLLAVDDGSRDDTWDWLCRAEQELPGRVRVFRLPRNRGKRHALHEGFRQATGEVLVTVDSDSVVEPGALRRLVSPFVRDPRVGGVAGNVRVLNVHDGAIPAMLNVCFAFTFEFIRAGQSVVNSVLCTPGALAAYRRKVLEPVLPEWLRQTFLGSPANIGEDRAATNLILRQGYHVVFQSDAVAYTNVPCRYGHLCRMLIRWARSNVREDIWMSRFAFRRFRPTPASGARALLLVQWVWTFGAPLLLAGLAVGLCWRWQLFLLTTACGTALWASVPGVFYLVRHRSHDALWIYAFAIFGFVALAWIQPYALCTVHRSGWLTRRGRGPQPEPASGGATGVQAPGAPPARLVPGGLSAGA